MREWSRTNVSNVNDPSALRGVITSMDVQLRELTTAVKLLGGGRLPQADNQPIPVSGGGVTAHSALSGLVAPADDHTQYLLLGGRAAQQEVRNSSTSLVPLKVNALSGTTADYLSIVVNSGATPVFKVGSGVTWQSTDGLESVTIDSDKRGLTQILNASSQPFTLKAYQYIILRNRTTGSTLAELHVGSGTGSPTLSSAYGMCARASGTGTESAFIVTQRGTSTGDLQRWEKPEATLLAAVSTAGNFIGKGLALLGSTSGTATIVPAATTTSHTLTLPSANATGALTNDGSGALSWGQIDNTYIASRTRNVFLAPVVFVTTTTTNVGTAPNQIQQKSCSGTTTTTFSTIIRMPADYSSLSVVRLLYSNAGTSTNPVIWNAYSKVLTDGTDAIGAYSGTSQINATPSGTTSLMKIESFPTSGSYFLTSVAANDYVRISVQRDATDANDTNTSAMQFHGISIEYTADM